jgi:YidC/Oxa1 family membrane protein insertase
MEKRAILAIVLSLIVVVAFQYLFIKPQPKQPVPAATQAQKDAATAPAPKAGQTAQPAAPRTETVEAEVIAPAKDGAAEKYVTVETPLYRAVFSTKGGALKSFKLKNYKKSMEENSGPVELVNMNGLSDYPLAVTFPESNIDVPAYTSYEADRESLALSRGSSGKVTFTVNAPGRLKVYKTFTFYADKYVFDLDVKVHNASQTNLNQKALLAWNEYVDPKAEEDSYGHDGPIYLHKNDITTESPKKIESRKMVGPGVSWGGYESKYFIMSLIPKQPSVTSLVYGKDSRNLVSVAMEGPKNVIPSGQEGLFSYSLYLGPKDYDQLKAQNVGLEDSIDYGWIKWLALPLLISMKFLYNYVLNYGIVIIILTILIKIIFWPLGNKSYKSMKEMQALQPKITELREKFKNDKQKLNQEIMGLYKKYKVNPMSGCLPMLIQIPVFFGLYKALLYSIELRHAPFFWWIQDLSAKDPYYITPIVMGATMLWQQKLSPQMGDPMQAKIMMLMPIVFTFLFLNFPSGLVIYWLFNNILSIGQQYYVNKRI